MAGFELVYVKDYPLFAAAAALATPARSPVPFNPKISDTNPIAKAVPPAITAALGVTGGPE